MTEVASLIASTLETGTVLGLAGLGLLISERAGIVNLGAEGLMLVGAVTGYATAVHSESGLLALCAGALSGSLLAACFGVLVIWLYANQYAAGLALSLLGSGLSAFVGVRYTQEKIALSDAYAPVFLRELPLVGRLLFSHHPLVYGTIVLAVVLALSLDRSRWGLVLRAIGESPESAHALGYRVQTLRWLAVVAGGTLCGLAGAYLSTVYTSLWVEGMVSGKGFIALALTTFSTWRPLRVLLGAYLFGGVTILQFHLQGAGVQIASQWLSMLPYLVTIFVLVLISRKSEFIRLNMPASLGRPFVPEG
jgi:general nucleoside transport system permease protein